MTDQGPGVPKEVRGTIFEPFHRAALGTPGKGLGLAIARDVAERHGGRLWVEDPPSGTGARFIATLPDKRPDP